MDSREHPEYNTRRRLEQAGYWICEKCHIPFNVEESPIQMANGDVYAQCPECGHWNN